MELVFPKLDTLNVQSLNGTSFPKFPSAKAGAEDGTGATCLADIFERKNNSTTDISL